MSVFSNNTSVTNGNKKRLEPVQAIHTLLGKGTVWRGDVHSGPNSLRIEGSVEGAIFSEGEVTIAPSGYVKGTIHAKHLIVTGKVEGVFKIAECLEIHGTGWVEGEVEVGSLVVDEGGTLQGSCSRRGVSKPKDKETLAAKPVKAEDRTHGKSAINHVNGPVSSSEEQTLPTLVEHA
jgi:cytoskeletal protein CcmA (bactofilin family)